MEPKELKAFYFPHDIGASNDPKLINLRICFGWRAIGMYWAIIEALHKEKNGELPTSLISAMILDFFQQEEIRTMSNQIEHANEFEESLYANALLVAQNGITTSKRVKENIEERMRKSESARRSATHRWENQHLKGKEDTKENKSVLRTLCEGNAIKKRKEKKIIEEATSDSVFLETLKKTYSWVNVDAELRKMDGWLLSHPGRQKTRKFITSWLNKVDKPVEIKRIEQKPIEYETTPEQQEKVAKLIRETVAGMR